jgi:hypothetical protein
VKIENNKLSGPFYELNDTHENNNRKKKTSDRLRAKGFDRRNCRKARESFDRRMARMSEGVDSVGKGVRKSWSIAGPIRRLGGLGGSSEEAREVEDKCGDMGD